MVAHPWEIRGGENDYRYIAVAKTSLWSSKQFPSGFQQFVFVSVPREKV